MKQKHINTAVFTAYLLAGASLSNRSLEGHGGNIGFACEAVRHARAIAVRFADIRTPDDVFPGVLEYELIEPLGAWIVDVDAQPKDTALRFETLYHDWINGAEHE